MTPFELDSLVNPPVVSKKKGADGLADLKRKQEVLGDFYEEEENDFGCRLYDKDFD